MTWADEIIGRRRTGWHRHITLAMLALALLAVIAATAPGTTAAGAVPIVLTVPEIRRLIAGIVLSPARRVGDILNWSQWRCRHQAQARRSHYQRRSQP
ncbi:hypothetical protein J5X84_43820 [Streptosporangiaceae bacterium NEAU-GS5]|nr:hypothetical protein [Streptosporangiaceae bacterium NEAU-GS5]